MVTVAMGVDDPPNLDPDDIVYRIMYGKRLPHEQALVHLRRGMKMIRIGTLLGSVETWLEDH
jgi:hypothetical protein